MSSPSFGKHASGATSGQPAVPEPSFAERARTLMHSGRIGSLSTISRKQPGFPFGSLMPYGLDDHGRPIFLISTMAMHTQNLQADPRASLFVTEPDCRWRRTRLIQSHIDRKCPQNTGTRIGGCSCCLSDGLPGQQVLG